MEGPFHIVNHTPHGINVYTEDGTYAFYFPAQQPCIRLDTAPVEPCAPISGGIATIAPPRYTGLLPASGFGPDIIVSQLVATYLMDHPEVAPQVKTIYCPDTGPAGAVRNDKGEITGTKRLVRYK